MLTQITNRSVEIETLTSGRGVVITRKDLTECLEECCRSLVRHGEEEMRTRCEHLSMLADCLRDQLYLKDRRIATLENKLKLAAREIDKIVGTRVFARGKDLIYELDQASRQLRAMQDSIFMFEKNLTDRIHLCYEKDLEKAKA